MNSPGFNPAHRQRTIIELMNDPKTALLKPAAPIPVASTITSCFQPGLVYPSCHSSPTPNPGSSANNPIPPATVVEFASATGTDPTSPRRCIVKRPRTKLINAARLEIRSACRPRSVILAVKSARRVSRWSSSPMLAEVPSRAERHISRLPLRLPIMGTRMNSSSTRWKTRQRARCSNNSPVKTSPTRLSRSEGVAWRRARGAMPHSVLI